MKNLALVFATLGLLGCGASQQPAGQQPTSPPTPAATAAAPAGHEGHQHAAGTPCNCKTKGQAPAEAATAPNSFAAAPAVGALARCPVSGEGVTVSEQTTRGEHQGKHYVFCCPGCKKRFDADPAKYAK